jgi:hypothetical protein
MGFLTPWFLAGVAAIGLPVWLHLLRKHKTTPLPFASLRFFERRTQSSIKHRRLRYLTLLALRTALVALLALAFAHPYVARRLVPLDRSGAVTVLAIDNSLSMRAADRLAQAREMARSVVRGLGPGERAQVLAFGSRVEAMSEVTADRAALTAAIAAIAGSDTRTSFAELARSLGSIANSLRLPLTVHLYSDMQQSGMPPNFNDLRLKADIKLVPHPLATAPTPNFTVENVVAPRRVYDARKARVLCTVAGYGTPKAVRKVTLKLNGREVESKTVEVPASGRESVEFPSIDVPYGRNRGEAAIDGGDALPSDDVFYFSVERADARHALFVHSADNPKALLYFKAALEASGQSAFAMDAATPDQLAGVPPAQYAFVVLSDVSLPAAFEARLTEYVRGGGSLLVALGRNLGERSKVPVALLPIGGETYAGREGDRFETAVWLDPSHPSILRNSRWEDVKFYRAERVQPMGARVVARLGSQLPLLLDARVGGGRVLVFASTFDNVDNDLPLHAAWVPFVEQTARYLGRLDDGPASVPVGAFAELRETKETGAAVDVVDPKGGRALSLEEATKAQNIQFTMAGFYDIRRPNGPGELVAVNSDRHESDLTPAPPETLELWQNTANGNATGGGDAAKTQNTLSLWWYAMLAVLALVVAESLLGNRHLSVDKEAA